MIDQHNSFRALGFPIRRAGDSGSRPGRPCHDPAPRVAFPEHAASAIEALAEASRPARAGSPCHTASARARTIDPADWSVDDAFPHYDQVGSVVAATGADGLASTRREADAWGNDLASWSTGLWAAPAGGWGHNTKAFDPAADLVYMHQRWYDPKTGTFASSAPYPPMIEHRYGFAENNPVMMVDPDGRDVTRWNRPVQNPNGKLEEKWAKHELIIVDLYDEDGSKCGHIEVDFGPSSGLVGNPGTITWRIREGAFNPDNTYEELDRVVVGPEETAELLPELERLYRAPGGDERTTFFTKEGPSYNVGLRDCRHFARNVMHNARFHLGLVPERVWRTETTRLAWRRYSVRNPDYREAVFE